MVKTESLPSTRHSREKVWEEQIADVWKSQYRFYTHEEKLPSRVVRDWHYTPRFNISQTLYVADMTFSDMKDTKAGYKTCYYDFC